MTTGRVPDYCCPAHRQAAYRLRKNGGERQRVSRQALELGVAIPALYDLPPVSDFLGPDESANGYKQSSLFAD